MEYIEYVCWKLSESILGKVTNYFQISQSLEAI